jgi:hypothetical protein
VIEEVSAVARARMGELKRVAQQLGVTTTVLRQHGWKTASAARVRAVQADPPDWLVEARVRRAMKRAKQRRLQDRRVVAARLGIQARAVKEFDLHAGAVAALLADPPDWLVAERQRRQAHIEQQSKDRLRADLSEALVDSVHEVWFQELKYAATAEQVAAIDARWAPEVDKAKREAQELAEHMGPEQVRARIERERDSARAAGVYRATQLVRRAIEGGAGG